MTDEPLSRALLCLATVLGIEGEARAAYSIVDEATDSLTHLKREVERLRSEREALLGVLEPAEDVLRRAASELDCSVDDFHQPIGSSEEAAEDCRNLATALEAALKGVGRG